MSRWERIGVFLARLIVGGLFVYAGALKALDPQAFAGKVAAYGLFPYSVNIVLAATLPYVEILAGLLLLVGRKLRPALLVVMALNLAFMVLLAWAWSKGLQIDCGCFRSGGATLPRDAFFRDLLLMILIVWVWLRPESEPVSGD